MSPEIFEPKKFPFRDFSENPFFIGLNRQAVKKAQIGNQDIVVDLGCGPGQVTQLIKQEGPRLIFAIDPDEEALKEARRQVQDTSTTKIQFLAGDAQHIAEVLPCKADKIIWANGPHLVPDEQRLTAFRSIKKILNPEGLFIFATTFYKEAYARNAVFFGRWVILALDILEGEKLINQEQRSSIVRPNLMKWGRADYQTALEKADFLNPTLEEITVQMTKKGLVDISRYYLFIRGSFGSIVEIVGLKKASEKLSEAARRLCEEKKIELIPRNWLIGVGFASS